MKVSVLDKGKASGEIALPKQFSEEVRPDLIKKAVLSVQSKNRQPYGADPRAGLRASGRLSKRRRDYRGSYGFGISRTPRKILSRRGRRMMWVGAIAPNTVSGRRAHPPKAEKIWSKDMNAKEESKAIRSCISATIQTDVVKERGHQVPENFPFVLNGSFEKLAKTKEVVAALKEMGLEAELTRSSKKSVRPGKGKVRGRKYKTAVGPLIVTSAESKISKSAANIPGVEIINVQDLNAEHLAPGAVPGRLTLWTKAAIEKLEKEKLFM